MKDIPTDPYSLDNLALIINVLAIKGLPILEPKDVEFAIEQANADIEGQVPSELYFICGRLQGMALEFLLNRQFESGARFTGARKILQHIAAADFDALPASIQNQLMEDRRQFSALRSTFRRIRQSAESILASLPKRGALPQQARYILVDQLADLYEESTGRRASKVGKDSPAKHPRKRSGRFRRFVLTALDPIGACAGADDVIDAVIDKRRRRLKKQGGKPQRP